MANERFTPPDDFEEDHNRWFEQRRQTFTGIYAGQYIDREDFEIYGRWATERFRTLTEEIEKLKAINAAAPAMYEALQAMEDLDKEIHLSDRWWKQAQKADKLRRAALAAANPETKS